MAIAFFPFKQDDKYIKKCGCDTHWCFGTAVACVKPSSQCADAQVSYNSEKEGAEGLSSVLHNTEE